MDFNAIPARFFKRVFKALNLVLLVLWVLLIADYELPRKKIEERVTVIEKKGHASKKQGRDAGIKFKVHTISSTLDATEMVSAHLISEGDTLIMEASPVMNKVYGLGIRDRTRPCCTFDIYRIRFELYTHFVIIAGVSMLLLCITLIPRLSYITKGTIAFFAYILTGFSVISYMEFTF